MNLAHDTSHVLNDLIQTCIDGKKGFESAANGVSDPSLRSELMGYSAQRQDFARQLQTLVESQGDDAAERGSAAAALHRGWINIKQALSTNDRYTILAECERGEDSAVKAYQEALEAGLPPAHSQVVQTQYAAVQRTHDRIRSLRDTAKAAR